MPHQSLFSLTLVYLLTAVVCVTAAKRFGVSPVLGYLVGGILVGPACLGFIGSEGADVMHFAEFGVVLMLFLVGLELKPALLWRLRGPILGLGSAQVLFTMSAIFGLGIAVGLAWQTALAIGMALSLSSTAIVLQWLEEKCLTKTAGGKSAFSVLLFQDIAVIFMLAALPVLASRSGEPSAAAAAGAAHAHENLNSFQSWLSHQPGWLNTLLVLAAVGSIILGGRYLFQPILSSVARTRVRETFVALALLLVMGVSFLMSQLGVSPALGAFLAGVVLANSEYRHELEADIEPFKGLLLSVFFISIGASIDFALVAERPLVITCLVLGLMTLKAIILLLLGRVYRLALDQRLLCGLALAQGGEFAFVLLGFAASEGVVTGEIAQLLIATVALTMALTPLVLMIEDRFVRPRVGTREAEEREPDAIDENAPVILAGFGRFGNFVGRLLVSQKIEVTVIDNDSDHIDFLRKIGLKAYYGDACRLDLLESAGAARARLLIIALDTEENVNRLIALAAKHFPHLQVMVRALSRPHHMELIENEHVDYAIHQHSGSAILLGETALRRLGFRAHQASRASRTFRSHDWESTHALAGYHRDETTYISRIREHLAELDRQLELDRNRQVRIDDASPWDADRLREDDVA